MTGLWIYPHLFGVEVPLATVMSFDIGVYLVWWAPLPPLRWRWKKGRVK